MTTTKFHKQFGQVEVISSDANFTTIVVTATGEEKKLANKYVTLSDVPFVKEKKVREKAVKYVPTEEDKKNAAWLEYQGFSFNSLCKESTNNYRKNLGR